MTKIDILMATYNGEKYLAEQIDSIIGQSFQDWRLIIHDDGSSDSTVQIIKNYVNDYPEKILNIDDGIVTGGAKNNFFHLMKYAKAENIMFSDQDDVWMKRKIEFSFRKMVETERNNPNLPILVHTDLQVVDEDLNTISDSMFKIQKLRKVLSFEDYLFVNNVTGCTVLANSKAIKFYNKNCKSILMHDWWLAIKVKQNHGVVVLLDSPLIKYRQHAGNVVGSVEKNLSHTLKKILFFHKSYQKINECYFQARLIKKINKFIYFYKKIMYSH